ncbi:MAG: TonB-dependent receptor [Candidatus Eisenbacteria bacterium]
MNSFGPFRASAVRARSRARLVAGFTACLIALLAAGQAHAEKILGVLIAEDSAEPLPFANIILTRVEGTVESPAGGTFTMEDGSYRLDATPGTYKMMASYIGYNALTVTEVQVAEGKDLTLNLTLAPSAMKDVVEEVEVTAKKIENSETYILQLQKKAAAVQDGISAAQISKTTDSNAADALQRVTGLSVVDGQNVYVRGLGERYSSTTVNGASVGSPEPNKRVMPMDMFAAGLLDNIVVQKTYTPDKPGDFGGGVVDVTTRDFPGTKVWSLSVGSGMNSNTTGKDFYFHNGGDWDFLGFDDGTRDVPDLIPSNHKVVPKSRFFPCETESDDFPYTYCDSTIEKFGESFGQDWKVKNRSSALPQSFSASYGNEVEFRDQPLGFLGSLSYSRGFKTIEKEENNYRDESLSDVTLYDHLRSTASVLWGAIGSVNYRLNDYNSIYLRGMYNRSADDEFHRWEGENIDYGVDYIRQTRFKYVERGILSTSVRGKSLVMPLFGSTLEWKVGYSEATRDEPDRREHLYERQEDGSLELSGRGTALQRYFGSQDESTWDYEANFTVPFSLGDGRESKLKLGALHSARDREFRFRRFGYINPSGQHGIDLSLEPDELLTADNVGGYPTTFRIQEFTQGTDAYNATHDITAGYAMIEQPVGQKVRMTAGARVESSDQRVETFDIFDPAAPDSVGRIDKSDVLPALNVTYQMSDKTNLRAAYARTLNRPDLRELSPFVYNDNGASAWARQGNPDLERAVIDNFDLRWETFIGLGELLAASAFYKSMTDPIEEALLGGQQPVYTPVNSKDAFLYGVELEARVALDRFSGALSSFSASTNLTLIESEAELGDVQNDISTSGTRPLTGQSPYVVNLGLFYSSGEGRTNASLLYTAFGERLRTIGAGSTPDIYERPRQSLDFSLARRFGGLTAKLGVENILDDEHLFEQEGSEETKVVERWKEGRNFSIGFALGS